MECKKLLTILLSITVLLSVGPPSYAQRGMGDTFGVAQQGLNLETVTIQGDVVRVITGPCEKTTGWAEIGSHFILKAEQGKELNIHLGPAQLVQEVTDMLSSGSNVTTKVFRTEKMPEGHYVAITVTVANKTIRLRDQNLRPVWAGQTGSKRYQSDTERQKDSEGSNVSSSRQLSGSYRCLRPQTCCRQFCSSERIGRGRGRGWGCNWQGSSSRRGFGMRRRGCRIN